jgi:outer membrane protein assembly factor BamA
VNQQVQDDPASISLVYQIDKGDRHKVAQIAFRGNRHFDEDDLSTQVATHAGHLFSRGRFSNELLTASVDSLTGYYHDAGFGDVKVQPKVVGRERQVYITFEISEGPQTLIDALHVEGNTTQPISKLAPDGLKLGPGKPYSQRLVNQDRDQIMATYLELGYLTAAFKSTVKAAPGHPHQVEATYSIEEGTSTRVEDVLVVGAQHTRRRFINRTADVRAGRPLSQGKLLESESRLQNTGVFDWASVGPRAPITDQREEEVLIKVHEAKRNSLTYGIGLQLIPRTGNVPAGTAVLPGLPPVGLPTSIQTSQQEIISPRGSLEYTRLTCAVWARRPRSVQWSPGSTSAAPLTIRSHAFGVRIGSRC